MVILSCRLYTVSSLLFIWFEKHILQLISWLFLSIHFMHSISFLRSAFMLFITFPYFSLLFHLCLSLISWRSPLLWPLSFLFNLGDYFWCHFLYSLMHLFYNICCYCFWNFRWAASIFYIFVLLACLGLPEYFFSIPFFFLYWCL